MGKKLWRHAKVQPGEARFGPELDGEKQVFGGRMREKNGRKLLVLGIQRQRLQEMKETLFFL